MSTECHALPTFVHCAPRANRTLLVVVVCLAGLTAQAAERQAVSPKPAETKSSPGNTTQQRQREGAVLTDVLGQFKLTGDRATFFPTDGQQRYVGLENLALERVAVLVSGNPDQLDWLVSGTITEYRGANYLLITRAILKNKPSAQNRAQLPGSPSKPNAR